MGKNILEYKGYVVKVCYDAKRCLLYGKVDGIVDAVNFETENPREVEQAFHDAVDHYTFIFARVLVVVLRRLTRGSSMCASRRSCTSRSRSGRLRTI